MGTSLRRNLSLVVGWIADRRVPGPLRPALYGLFARFTGADPEEAQLPPSGYPSLGAFFVRRLKPGLRPLSAGDETLLSPADGVIQALDRVDSGSILQAKGQPYRVDELLAGAHGDQDLDGAWAVTIYLGPRDYHRVHTPCAGRLRSVAWVPGDRRSVAAGVVAGTPRVFVTNERAVLTYETAAGPLFLVMVGALNVGRIRVVGVAPETTPARAVPFERGAELARFELGSTVVLILPPGHGEPAAELEPGSRVRQGSAMGRLLPPAPGA